MALLAFRHLLAPHLLLQPPSTTINQPPLHLPVMDTPVSVTAMPSDPMPSPPPQSAPSPLRSPSSPSMHTAVNNLTTAFSSLSPPSVALPRYAQPTAASLRRVAPEPPRPSRRPSSALPNETPRFAKPTSSSLRRIAPTPPRPTRRPSAALPSETPRFAQPTLASQRRHMETLKQLSDVTNDVTNKPSLRPPLQPTIPKSPNLRLNSRLSAKYVYKPTTPSNDEQKVPGGMRRRASATVPKSPMFRSRGPARRSTVNENSPPRSKTFVPAPLPAFLLDVEVLPDVKLNKKTEARMNARINPQPLAASRPIPPKRVSVPSPTVAQPFELHSVEMHERYVEESERTREQELEQERIGRSFQAKDVDRRIFEGPTFVPGRNDMMPTQPKDLLPFAAERSERTLAYEAAQKLRVEVEMAEMERERAEREEEKARQELEAFGDGTFKAREVPRSHYEPHMMGECVERSELSEGTMQSWSRTRAAVEEVSKVMEDEDEEEEEEEEEEWETPAAKGHEEKSGEDGGSGASSGWMERMRQSLSPLLGSNGGGS